MIQIESDSVDLVIECWSSELALGFYFCRRCHQLMLDDDSHPVQEPICPNV